METKNNERTEFKVYNRRFAVLVTVVILNISNAAMWISYSPVATTVANYYNVETQKVNWFSLVFMITTMPFTFFSTFIIDKVGLKFGIYLGASLNCVGAIVRAFGTSGVIADLDAQYAVSLTGQVIAAMAQSFLLFIPTKVSQSWFPESQRAISTTVLAMSNPLGIVIADVLTPLIVNEREENVPTNNYVWAGLAVVSLLLTFVCITRSKPETPPSQSAVTGDRVRPPYFTQLKQIFTTVPYIFLLFTLGCGIGIFNAVATLTQQLLCPLGYSDVFGGLCIASMIIMGFAGSATMGILADKTKLFSEITKVAFGFSALFFIFMFEFYLVPNQKAALIIFCALFGFFGVGAYPVGLELAVEATFPIEESISTAFIFLSGQIQGSIWIVVVPALSVDQDRSLNYLNRCDSDTNAKPQNYSIPLMIIMSWMATLVSVMILFMNTRYKRLEAEQKRVGGKEEEEYTNEALDHSHQPQRIEVKL